MDWNALLTPLVAALAAAVFGIITAALLAGQTWFQEWRAKRVAARKQAEEDAKEAARQAEEKKKAEAQAVVARKVDSTVLAAAKVVAEAKGVVAESKNASAEVSTKLDAMHETLNGNGIMGELRKIRQAQMDHDVKDDERFAELNRTIGVKTDRTTDHISNPGDPFQGAP